jgi:flavin reductase (DIM6/NTAB) family NADH-FMN oxidoreductase RutF
MIIDPAKLDWKGAHELLVSAVLPRPIAWISTIGPDGVHNLAPYSFFIPLSIQPAIVGVGIGWKRDGTPKDTLANIEFTKDFVVNIVTEALAQAMNQTSKEYPRHIDEFKAVGLTAVKGDLVKSPRLLESPVNLECQLRQILEFGAPPRRNSFVIGEILRVHVRDELWDHGTLQTQRLPLVGRMNEDFYVRTTDLFEMKRPDPL